jgi:transposase
MVVRRERQMGGILGRRLRDEERAVLASWQRSHRRAKYVRARIILLAEDNPNASAVARLVGVTPKTVRQVVSAFRQGGLALAEPKVQRGPRVRFGEAAAEQLIAILHESPLKYGFDEARWTLEMAAVALARELGVESVGRETVRLLLRQKHHSWLRAKEWLVSPDPEYAFRKAGASG